MRIVLRKISDDRHTLEIVRDDGSRDLVECETRSYLQHDLLHYAVESEAKLARGFWGELASGRTLSEMNDRTGGILSSTPEMLIIEQIVGALSGVMKGRPADLIVSTFRDHSAAIGSDMPAWLTERFVTIVQQRMRALIGHWKATPYGGTMDLRWPS